MKNISLIISALIVVPIGIIYGFQPNLLFDIHVNSIDEHNVFKAIMGIYYSFAIFWTIGILNQKYWETAIVSNFIFMFGLAFGRIVSLYSDGIPSYLFVFGTIGEILLGFYSFIIWKRSIVKTDHYPQKK
jgi:hypothetical protein